MPGSTYDLALIVRLISEGQYVITREAEDGAFELGFEHDDICECILEQLDETHFYKTMPAQRRRGFMQDVYRITYEGRPIYLKLQIADKRAVVIQFKAE